VGSWDYIILNHESQDWENRSGTAIPNGDGQASYFVSMVRPITHAAERYSGQPYQSPTELHKTNTILAA